MSSWQDVCNLAKTGQLSEQCQTSTGCNPQTQECISCTSLEHTINKICSQDTPDLESCEPGQRRMVLPIRTWCTI